MSHVARATTGLTLDTGALIALDHPASASLMQARLDEARSRVGAICIPANVIAQAWRGSRQARLARLIRSRDVEIAVLTLNAARVVGELCADSGHRDVVDAYVALCARERGHAVVTSDPDDLARIDPSLRLIRV
jgi:predicted nucleic acid-binding protein